VNEENVNSSLNIWIFISVAVLLCGGVGWFLLDTEPKVERATSAPEAAPATTETVDARIEVDTRVGEPVAAAAAPPVAETPVLTPDSEVDADLRKAQIAAAAEILAEPARQSALHYYGRVLDAEPDHEIANAELDSVLSQLQIIVNGHIAADRLADAYRLAGLVAAVRPRHAIIETVQQDLDTRAGRLVEDAMGLARGGNNTDAIALIERAEALPGQNPAYYAAIRESIADVDQSLRDAARQQAEDEHEAYLQEANAWAAGTRAAIASGNLIGPSAGNARELFLGRTVEDEFTLDVQAELAASMLVAIDAAITRSDLEAADTLLAAAPGMGVAEGDIAALQNTVDERYAADKADTLLAVNELVRLKNAAARYPKRAVERGISGWVEVTFVVTQSGATSDIQISEAEPRGVFDSAVLKAVEQWEFEPRVVRGRTVDQRAVARLVFSLE